MTSWASRTFPSIAIHRGMTQDERLAHYKQFKDFQKRILVATNLFGRGMDIERVNIVFNYDMPEDTNMYLHRVARLAGSERKDWRWRSSQATMMRQFWIRFKKDLMCKSANCRKNLMFLLTYLRTSKPNEECNECQKWVAGFESVARLLTGSLRSLHVCHYHYLYNFVARFFYLFNFGDLFQITDVYVL